MTTHPDPAAPLDIRTCEMHTGGEPVRIITGGLSAIPEAPPSSSKRRDARERLDHLRRLLMFEPRGHFDMYGVLLVRPTCPDADLAVLFMHNEGYSTMCGHAVIALGRCAVDTRMRAGARARDRGRASSAPAGWCARYGGGRGPDGRPGPFRKRAGLRLRARRRGGADPGFGPVTLDIGYGGAFYAVLPAAELGLDVARARPARTGRGGDGGEGGCGRADAARPIPTRPTSPSSTAPS